MKLAFIALIFVSALAINEAHSEFVHHHIRNLMEFNRHMAANDEACPPFNSSDIDDWSKLSKQEQNEVKDFYNSICELLKLLSDDTPAPQNKTNNGKSDNGKAKGRKLADNTTTTAPAARNATNPWAYPAGAWPAWNAAPAWNTPAWNAPAWNTPAWNTVPAWNTPVTEVIAPRWNSPVQEVIAPRWNTPVQEVIAPRTWSAPVQEVIAPRTWSSPVVNEVVAPRSWAAPVQEVYAPRAWNTPVATEVIAPRTWNAPVTTEVVGGWRGW